MTVSNERILEFEELVVEDGLSLKAAAMKVGIPASTMYQKLRRHELNPLTENILLKKNALKQSLPQTSYEDNPLLNAQASKTIARVRDCFYNGYTVADMLVAVGITRKQYKEYKKWADAQISVMTDAKLQLIFNGWELLLSKSMNCARAEISVRAYERYMNLNPETEKVRGNKEGQWIVEARGTVKAGCMQDPEFALKVLTRIDKKFAEKKQPLATQINLVVPTAEQVTDVASYIVQRESEKEQINVNPVEEIEDQLPDDARRA